MSLAWLCALQLVAQYGPEADRHLFRCLFSHVDFSGDGRSTGKDSHQVCSHALRILWIIINY
jgi:hypothetical protein